jgi:hypothetical protein
LYNSTNYNTFFKQNWLADKLSLKNSNDKRPNEQRRTNYQILIDFMAVEESDDYRLFILFYTHLSLSLSNVLRIKEHFHFQIENIL